MLSELRPAVEDLLGTGDGVRVEVWLESWQQRNLTRTGYPVLGADGDAAVIHLNDSAPHARATLAHELVHALGQEKLGRLPPLLEEGYASWVADQLAPTGDPMLRVSEVVNVGAYLDGLLLKLEVGRPDPPDAVRSFEIEVRFDLEGDDLTPEEVFSIQDREAFRQRTRAIGRSRTARLYSLSRLCFERVVANEGPEGLDALIERAEDGQHDCVPWAWIEEASGLHSRRDWLEAAWQRLTPEDVRLLAETQPGLVLPTLRAVCEQWLLTSPAPATPMIVGLRRSGARLVFSSGAALPLSQLEPLAAAVGPDESP